LHFLWAAAAVGSCFILVWLLGLSRQNCSFVIGMGLGGRRS
jgi:hypothetical protein